MEETKYSSNLNPFSAVWIRTRETVRYIIEEKSDGFIWLLVALAGVSGALLGSLDSAADEFMPGWGIVFGSIIAGPIVGIIGTAISSAIFLWMGKVFRGESTYTEMFRAVAAAQIPQIWLLPVLLIWLLSSPATFFLPAEAAEVTEMEAVLSVVATLILLVVSVWTFVIQYKGVAEAHRISSWKGFFTVLLTGLVFTVVLTAIVILIALLFIG